MANKDCLKGESISIATPTKNHKDNVFVSANIMAWRRQHGGLDNTELYLLLSEAKHHKSHVDSET